jgi:asparagine synthetase B (glutamine-hydrolysing)
LLRNSSAFNAHASVYPDTHTFVLMILGIFGGQAPVPIWLRWLRALDIKLNPTVSGPVHLADSGGASTFHKGALWVVCEGASSGAPNAERVADAYSKLGASCLAGLSGRFRFLLHDARAGHLLASCSAAPPWPLAYWSGSGLTLVCSEVLPLLRCPEVSPTLDESYLLHSVLGLGAAAEGRTSIRGIRRLCSGETLLVDSNGPRIVRRDLLTPRVPRGVAGSHLFIEELARAVVDHAATGRSVISLSGGLDSAALCAAGLQRAGPLDAMAFAAPALAGDAERDSLDAMQRAWPRLRLASVDVSDATDLPELSRPVRDDPGLTPLALLPARLRLWARAHDAGVGEVIEGEGGDELFNMLPTPLDAMRRGHLVAAARQVFDARGRRDLVEQGLWLPWLPRDLQRRWLARRNPTSAQLPAFVNRDAIDRPGVQEAVDEYRASLVHRPFERRLREWISDPMVVGAWLSRRHLAAGCGIDLAWPLLERPVLELVLGLHAIGAVHGGRRKPFLQEALRGLVPDSVRLQSKDIGLYHAFIPRILTSARAREAVRDVRVKARLADLVRFDRIEAMLDGLAAGRPLGAGALWQLECLVCFADWYVTASSEYGVV